MEQERKIDVMIAEACHEEYVDIILDTIEAAAKVRGTGIAKRTHEYVAQKMKEGKAVIALEGNKFAGFSYIESWGNKQYVTTSGLIVHPDFRELGYVPVTFADRTDDEAFWRGCEGCVNHDILERTGRRYCICTGMLFDPDDPHRAEREAREIKN